MRDLWPRIDSKGFTLPETLVSLAPMTIVILMIGGALYMGVDSISNFERLVTRDQLQRDIVRTLASPRAIFNTCAANPAFAQCFNGGAATCAANVTNDLILIDEIGLRLGGTTATPAYFLKNGSVCTEASNTACDFRVITQFRAQGFPSNCGSTCFSLMPMDAAPPAGSAYDKHELLIIRYSITPLTKAGGAAMAERIGSVILPLNDLYTTGCVPL